MTLAEALAQVAQLTVSIPVELILASGLYDDATSGGVIDGGNLTLGPFTQASKFFLVGADGAVLRASALAAPIITIESGAPEAVVAGLCFEGSGSHPSIIVLGSSLQIQSCIFASNSAGALRIQAGELVVSDSTFAGNGDPAIRGGALQVFGGSLHVAGSVFELNRGHEGGAILIESTAIIQRYS